MENVPQDAPQEPPERQPGRLDSGLSIRELEAQITELAGHLNAANHRWLVLIAEFDRRNGWSDGATQSCAHWLSWKCGLDLGAAREKVRVARAIESLPQISAAMANGRLSYSKARALTRVATPATEDVLLNVALQRHHAPRRDARATVPSRAGSRGALARGAAVRATAAHVLPRQRRLAGGQAAAHRPRAARCSCRPSRRRCRKFRCRTIVKIRCTFQLKRRSTAAGAAQPCVAPMRSS